jgi:hypothetical protein
VAHHLRKHTELFVACIQELVSYTLVPCHHVFSVDVCLPISICCLALFFVAQVRSQSFALKLCTEVFRSRFAAMGHDIYEDTLKTPERKSSTVKVSFDKAAAEDIFHQHAGGDAIFPGTSFNNACLSLASAYPRTVLSVLRTQQMQGRAWEIFDENHDGTLDVNEFLMGFEDCGMYRTPRPGIYNNMKKCKQI